MRALLLVSALLTAAGPAWAQAQQGPERPPQEQDPERLRREVVQRFMENYRTQAGLTDEQYARLQESVRRQWESRRQFQERERQLTRALEQQLRPGVAADADSVTRLLDAMTESQAQRVETLRAEQRELQTYLSTVQRAQLVLAFTRLERQIQDLVQRRLQAGAPPARRP